ncbi:Uma2 family endonuclease [Crocosphaera sp. UHCC 0190]|uniref:Uma2 family endonuclease n=1 Tax=Crocosphaera sp. UHCC 0190 TaxID=3110246 RepID=UPI002B1F7388|nr:Uma2 family endonuclease [Crocosphaera sp. UHCC 0190]MEA5510967.1 Uma2 family endonuclease [Crocosphaera sp. UHCC 0190]
MTSVLLNDSFPLQLEKDDSEEKFITSGVTWQVYESFLTSLGNHSSYRVAYLSKTLEIMSPSRSHELDKKAIARLLEAYLEEKRIRFWGLGSTTLKREDKQAGKEPDECYCIATDKDIPDLAIEVVYTSGGIDTLEIYRRLGVLEVWFWQDRQFRIYCLQDDSYQQTSQSQLLPNLDLSLLAQYVIIDDPLQAITQWRKQIEVN